MSNVIDIEKQIEDHGKKLTRKGGRKPRAIECPEQYLKWTIDQLAHEMKPQHYAFALEAGYTGIHSRAYGNHVAREGSNPRSYSGAAADLIRRHPGVRAVIAKVRVERVQSIEYDMDNKVSTWIVEMRRLGEVASEHKQMGPAIRALELIAKVLGLFDHPRQASNNLDSSEALAILTEAAPDHAEDLSKLMEGNNPV